MGERDGVSGGRRKSKDWFDSNTVSRRLLLVVCGKVVFFGLEVFIGSGINFIRVVCFLWFIEFNIFVI